jgi:hypothetical protein
MKRTATGSSSRRTVGPGDEGSRYEGEFRNSMKHGKGTEKFAYGDFYVGEFSNGL